MIAGNRALGKIKDCVLPFSILSKAKIKYEKIYRLFIQISNISIIKIYIL